MIHKGTYDGTIYHNPANRFCIISVKTADKEVPLEARSTRRYRDHLIRFVATGYELPRTDAVELELDGEWKQGKYGMQFQVEQWRQIVPRTKSGVEGYLASGLIKGIGPATATLIVSRFGEDTLDILQKRPERLLEIKGITESKLEEIKTSYAESRMLQDLLVLLSPFKITPKTALKIYQYFGPASVDILKKSPFELCQISGFGFLRVDAIVQKNGGDLHDPMRVKGALFWALEDGKGSKGHLFLPGETLQKEALRLLNNKIPVPALRLQAKEVADVLQDMILKGEVVAVKDNIYLPRVFAQEDETARRIAMRLVEPSEPERIERVLERVKREMGVVLSSKQESAVYAAYRHNLSIITGSPGTGKTTVLKTILEVYRRLHPDGQIVLMAPTGRASRRMAESTGFDMARTLHSGLGLGSEEDDVNRTKQQEPLSADLIIVDEFSMVDMWLADKFFSRIKDGARIVLVGDPDQLPSVGAGNVFRELIDCKLVPVTVLDQIFRQSKDSLIAYNAKFINEGNTKLYYGPDFMFMASDNQADAAERIISRYCREIEKSGIDRVQILSPFRSEGAASAEQLNEAIREVVNPFRSAEDEIKIGVKVFRVNDRIMQTKNTAKVSNGDLGFIRYIKDGENGKRVGLDFGVGRELEYSVEDMVNLDLAYATTIHKSMGSEYETVIMPLLKAHSIMLYQKLWFRMAHPNGRMRVTALRITEQMAIFEARVFLDRSDAEPFSMSVAQQQLQDNRDFIRGAQNEALSQALTDAGFGIQLISADAQAAVGHKKADATEKKAAKAAPIQVERTEPRQTPASTPQKPAAPAAGDFPSNGHKTQQRAPVAPETAVTALPVEPVEQRLPVEPVKAEKVVPTDTVMATAEPGAVEQTDELPLPTQKAEMRIEPKGNDAPAQDEAPAYTQNTPVEELLQVMTLEQARQVVVDDGIHFGTVVRADQVSNDRYRQKEKAGVLLTGSVILQNRVVPGPVPDFIADHISAPERGEVNEVPLLKLSQDGKRLTLKTSPKPLRQFFERTDPFAGVDGVADAINAPV